MAVDDLIAAAVTGGIHACDVGFARDVVEVLETAGRAWPRVAGELDLSLSWAPGLWAALGALCVLGVPQGLPEREENPQSCQS